MEWRVWINWWIIFCIRYSKLLWVYHKKTWRKVGYYPQISTYEAMKSFWSTQSEITKGKNGESVPYLEITEVVLMYSNVVNNDYQQDSWIHFLF